MALALCQCDCGIRIGRANRENLTKICTSSWQNIPQGSLLAPSDDGKKLLANPFLGVNPAVFVF